jgi:hypothetical protein
VEHAQVESPAQRVTSGVRAGAQDAELVVLVGPLTSSLKRRVTCTFFGVTVFVPKPTLEDALFAPSPTYSARGRVLKVIRVVSPNCIGVWPERTATVEPVCAFSQSPAAMFFGRVMLDVARTATAALSFRG